MRGLWAFTVLRPAWRPGTRCLMSSLNGELPVRAAGGAGGPFGLEAKCGGRSHAPPLRRRRATPLTASRAGHPVHDGPQQGLAGLRACGVLHVEQRPRRAPPHPEQPWRLDRRSLLNAAVQDRVGATDVPPLDIGGILHTVVPTLALGEARADRAPSPSAWRRRETSRGTIVAEGGGEWRMQSKAEEMCTGATEREVGSRQGASSAARRSQGVGKGG